MTHERPHLFRLAFMILAAGVYLVACSGPQSQPKVRLAIDAGDLVGCRYVGKITGESDDSHREAVADLQQGAEQLGADSLAISSHASGWGGVRIGGKAYVCPVKQQNVVDSQRCRWKRGCKGEHCVAAEEFSCYVQRIWS